MSFAIVRFTPLFGLKGIPVHHVSLELEDMKTNETLILEHPSAKESRTREEIKRVPIGTTNLRLDEIKRTNKTRRVYIPGVYDCRHYVLEMTRELDVSWSGDNENRRANRRAIQRGLPNII